MLLSWCHTNLRLKVTLNYFLPVLLGPAYVAAPRPDPATVLRFRESFAETLRQLNSFLASQPFLAGPQATVPDLLYAADLCALDTDEEREAYLAPHEQLVSWLTRMRELPHFDTVHRQWNAVVPLIKDRLAGHSMATADPSWVADVCERIKL
jgi:glutathione S-transferase